jgi:hypothetical protein
MRRLAPARSATSPKGKLFGDLVAKQSSHPTEGTTPQRAYALVGTVSVSEFLRNCLLWPARAW